MQSPQRRAVGPEHLFVRSTSALACLLPPAWSLWVQVVAQSPELWVLWPRALVAQS